MVGAVFIVGGRGYVGAHVTRAFIDDGWAVTVYGPPMADDLLADRAGRFADVAGSIEDGDATARALRASGAELVVSLAAYSSGAVGLARASEGDVERALAVNVLGHRRLLDACCHVGVARVLWASSTVVFGPRAFYGERRVDEAAERRPQTAYGLSKVLAEDVAQYYRDRFGLAVTGVWLPLVLGPGCWYAGVAGQLVAMFDDLAAGRPARLEAPAGAVDFAHTADAARAFTALATTADGPEAVYHLTAFAASFAEVAEEAARQVEVGVVDVVSSGGAIDYPLIDGGRLARDTGCRPAFDLAATVRACLRASRGEEA